MKLIFRSQMDVLYRFHGFVWVGWTFISTFYFMMKARGQFFEPFDQHYFDQHLVISTLNFPKKYGEMGQYWQKRVVWRFIHRIPVITNAQCGIFLFRETLIYTNPVWPYGTMVARLTPGQKVECSSYSGVIAFCTLKRFMYTHIHVKIYNHRVKVIVRPYGAMVAPYCLVILQNIGYINHVSS